MNLSLLFLNILPLCALIGLGYFAGKRLKVEPHSLAGLAIFILAPVVNFGAVARLTLDPAYLALPVIVFAICAAVTLGSYALARRFFPGNVANFIGMASSSGNTGYFGLPIVVALFGGEAAGVYLLANLAVVLGEIIIGYYVGARGHYDIRESLRKLARMPAPYAIVLALLWNVAGLPFPELAVTWWQKAAGAWSILGMMLIGVILSRAGKIELHPGVMAWIGAVKFIVWPALTYGFAMIDAAWLGWYGREVHVMLLILGIVPLAGNLSAFATQLGLRSGEAAAMTVLSTLFSIVYIPAVFWILGP